MNDLLWYLAGAEWIDTIDYLHKKLYEKYVMVGDPNGGGYCWSDGSGEGDGFILYENIAEGAVGDGSQYDYYIVPDYVY